MFKICNDKTYYVVQTTSEDVVVEIYTKKDGRGKNIPNRVCMTSDVKDAKEFTFEEAAAIQNDFSMVFPSLKKQGSYL